MTLSQVNVVRYPQAFISVRSFDYKITSARLLSFCKQNLNINDEIYSNNKRILNKKIKKKENSGGKKEETT